MTKADFVTMLRWPAKQGKDLAPWYVILWRSVWVPVIYFGLSISWLGVCMIMGYGEARQFWRDAL